MGDFFPERSLFTEISALIETGSGYGCGTGKSNGNEAILENRRHDQYVDFEGKAARRIR